MAHKWDDSPEYNRDDSSADPELDFESFLRRKVDECTQDVPTSQLSTTTPASQESHQTDVNPPANIVADGSESVISQQTHDPSLPSGHQPASDVAEKAIDGPKRAISVEYTIPSDYAAGNTIEVREHPIAGSHVVEHQVVLTVDAEWVRISNESYTMAVVDLSCEKIIERIHDLNRLRFLIPAQQFGLQNALEELLKSRNSEDRAKLTALMSENYRKLKARSQPTSRSAKSTKDKAVGKGASMNASGKGQKAAKALHSLGFDKDSAIEKVKLQGLYDSNVAAYLEKLYGAA